MLWLLFALPAAPVRLILDTDMGGGPCQDVDDVGTLCMLHALADNGEAELLAVVLDTVYRQGAGAVSVGRQSPRPFERCQV